MVNMARTQEIVDTIHGPIAYSGIEQAVIGTPMFNRLHRVLQNSLVYLTYPSNKVKRFEHSLGTMHLAGQFFFRSVCNTSLDTLKCFFDEVNEQIVKWAGSEEIKGHHYISSVLRNEFREAQAVLKAPWPKDCRLYIESTPANLSEDQYLSYYVIYQAVRLTGLLHDVGHLPYSHVTEYVLQAIYQQLLNIPEENRNKAQSFFMDSMKPYCNSSNSDTAIHERLGQNLVDKIFESVTEDLPGLENKEYFFLAIVLDFTKKILRSKEADNTLWSDLHRIVDGTLDCDRMDYCCRDQYCAGTSKDLLNYGRIFASLTIVYMEPERKDGEEKAAERQRCYFVPSTKALREIENLLRRRWEIYVTINYHHRVHKHELLFQHALVQLGMEEMERAGEEPLPLEDILPLEVSSIWRLVALMNTSKPVEYTAIQLDDSWLDTLLKCKFFERYKDNYLSFSKHGGDMMWHRMDELISVKKHYHSLIKHPDTFQQFDELVYRQLANGGDDELLTALGYTPSIKYSEYVEKYGEYVFNRALGVVAVDKELRAKFFTELERRVRELIQKDKAYKIMDCFLSDCSFGTGIRQTDTLYITAPGQGEKPFMAYSKLHSELSREKGLLPSVHIYYLPVYDAASRQYQQIDTNHFLSAVAKEAQKVIVESFHELSSEAEQMTESPMMNTESVEKGNNQKGGKKWKETVTVVS